MMSRLPIPKLTLSVFLLTYLIALTPVATFAQTKATINKPNKGVQMAPEMAKLLDKAEQAMAKYQWAAALKTLDTMLKLAQQKKDYLGIASALYTKGNIYSDTGESPKALSFLLKALPIYRQIKDKQGEAGALNSIGVVYSDMGEPAKAIEYYQRAIPLFQETKEKLKSAGTLANLGIVYAEMGQMSKALEFLQKALPIFKQLGYKEAEAATIDNIGSILSETNKQKALSFYQQALVLRRELGDKSSEAATLTNIGHLYEANNEPKKALEFLLKALPIHQATGNKQFEANTLHDIATVYLDTNDLPKALEFYQKTLPIYRQDGHRQSEANALHNIGLVYLAQSQIPEAEKAFESSLSLIESIRFSLSTLSTETKTAFQGENNETYLLYSKVLLQENKHQEAYVALQRMKGRTLLEQFQAGHVTLQGHLTKEEKAEEAALTRASNQASGNLLSANDKADVDKAKAQLVKTEDALNTFYDHIYTKYPDLAIKRAVKTATLEEIASGLPEDTALVEFLTLKLSGFNKKNKNATDETVLFIVTKGADGKPNLVVHHLPISLAELTEKVSDLREASADKALRPYQGKAKELYQILFAPAEKELTGKTRLVICPDGPLWDLPFAVLMDKDGKHLIEKNEIIFAYSGTAMKAALDARATQKPAPELLLALANPDFGDEARFDQSPIPTDRPITIPDRQSIPDTTRGKKLEPLPGTQREADTILKDFGTKATILTKDAAQEKTLKEKASSVRYLHLATHGYFNDAAPFQSFIALAQPPKGDKEDGLLTAREVFDLDLSSCELTVLSACESGRGETKAGEGIVGMTWALFAAGCPTEIVSQWNVNDASTADLMAHFYHDLSTGKSKGESLRQAALSLLADPKYKHPRFWSPFVLLGDWR